MSRDEDGPVTQVQDAAAAADDPLAPVTLDRGSVVDTLLDEAGPRSPPALTERYSLEREIAAGAMGRVFLARDRDINRSVAVKVMKAGRGSAQARRRFVEEVQLAGQLAHPNIVPIHDVGLTDDGAGWYTMRFVEGTTLVDVIARLRTGDPLMHARFTTARRLKLFFGVCDAIAYAHSRGVIHRDLKPGNILVGTHGEALVADWGIAKRIGRVDAAQFPVRAELEDPTATHEGSVIGTPAYMAPEQARGENDAVDARSDVYALSAILFELLSLKHYLYPVDPTGDGAAVIKAVLENVPHLASTARHPAQTMRVPVDIARVLARGLAKDPALRWQSVNELKDALLRIEDGISRVQCPTTAQLAIIGGARRLLSRAPVLGFITLFFLASLTVWGAVDVVMRLVR